MINNLEHPVVNFSGRLIYMEFNIEHNQQMAEIQHKNKLDEFVDNNSNLQSENLDDMEEVVKSFSAVFINKMFETMRDTLPEDKFLDGGFGEDVFQGMLDKEISKQAADRTIFKNLNQKLMQQLSPKNE